MPFFLGEILILFLRNWKCTVALVGGYFINLIVFDLLATGAD